jgi:hypothetical protein
MAPRKLAQRASTVGNRMGGPAFKRARPLRRTRLSAAEKSCRDGRHAAMLLNDPYRIFAQVLSCKRQGCNFFGRIINYFTPP